MNLCKNGHDLKVVGVYARNQCSQCHKDKSRKKYAENAEFRQRAILNAKKNRKKRAKTKEEWLELDKVRFMSYVDKNGNNGCWNWTGNILKTGYGSFSAKRSTGKTWRAHRFAWIIHGNELKEALELCHTCDNRKCVNPSHIWQGSRKENMQDMRIKNRNPLWIKTHCKHGHELNSENTFKRYDGFRECLICSKETKRRWYLNKKKKESECLMKKV